MSRPVIGAERRQQVYELVLSRRSVSVSALADELGFDARTIRKDLDALQREGKLVRSHGGAAVRQTHEASLLWLDRLGRQAEEKVAIGKAALEYLPQTSAPSIYLNSGSTTYELAMRIPPDRVMYIATNSPQTATYLASRTVADVLLFGGRLSHDVLVSDLSASREAVSEVYYNVAFMGAAGIDIKHGISEQRCFVDILRMVMDHSSQVIMLCDSSKLGRVSYLRVGPVSLIDVLITDWGADPRFVKQLRDQGIEVVIANPAENGGNGRKG